MPEADQTAGWEASEFFFIPEKDLPDRFYTTMNEFDSFEDIDPKYRIQMDSAGLWIQNVYVIIQATPIPRTPRGRPVRNDPYCYDIKNDKQELAQKAPPSIAERTYDKFFRAIMTHCANQMPGLLVVLSRDHPLGDFGFCQYRWTQEERDAFLKIGRPPCYIHNLPSSTPMVPLYLFCRSRANTSRGPSLSTPEVVRINHSTYARLLIFDTLGEDGGNFHGPLLLVPSDDISLTKDQWSEHIKNMEKNKKKEFSGRVSLLAEQLHSGLLISDYLVRSGGHLLYESDRAWQDVWELLQRFMGSEDFHYPAQQQRSRSPRPYQIPLRTIHQSLVQRHTVIGREM